jgi:hypothetical protein
MLCALTRNRLDTSQAHMSENASEDAPKRIKVRVNPIFGELL